MCIFLCVYKDVCIFVYIYIYIYSPPQTDCFNISQLIIVARHVRCLKLWSKPCWLYASWIFYRVNEGILMYMYHFCFVYIYTLNGIYIYIYIFLFVCKHKNICICIYIYLSIYRHVWLNNKDAYASSLARWVECLPMVQET